MITLIGKLQNSKAVFSFSPRGQIAAERAEIGEARIRILRDFRVPPGKRFLRLRIRVPIRRFLKIQARM